MASAVKKSFKLKETLLPNSDNTPRVKAISAAIVTPQPPSVGVPKLKRVKMTAGTTIPPNTAAAGNDAFYRLKGLRLILLA